MTFQELGLAEPVLRAIVSEGYTTPTPIQTQAIPHVLAGSDLLGCAQTGTGKTAAFALPILHRLLPAEAMQFGAEHGETSAWENGHARPGRHEKHAPRGRGRKIRVLVLSPTRELAVQIAESFHAYGRFTGLRHTVVYGGVGQRPQTDALQRGVEILVATPGRLADLMQQGYIDLNSVDTFVLDEADRMLDMGFLPDVKRIIAKLPAKRQTLFFSATMPTEIERLANAILRDPVRVRIVPVKATAELIEQSVYFVPKQQKPRLLADFLTTKAITRALIFTRTKHGADRVAKQLNQAGIRAEAIHGNKSQSARQRTLASFKGTETQVLVATDIAARGIDVDGISHVLNYDLPHEPETYVHRIGRTGRAGATGIAVSFCDEEERSHLKAIERLIRKTLMIAKDIPLRMAKEAPARQERSQREREPVRVGSTRASVHPTPRPDSTGAVEPQVRRRRKRNIGLRGMGLGGRGRRDQSRQSRPR